jgi:methylmalonyl-CoA mutase N-terminal domain/subunit
VAIDLLRVDPEVERQQVARLRQVRASRSEAEWRAAVGQVGRVAASGENLMPPIIAAVEARASVGEISNTLRGVFGEYRESVMD